jgi:GNAT superfamily N-acetyltransferase
VREAVVEDAAAVVALRREVYPYLLRGVESTSLLISSPSPGRELKAFVAELEGRLVGWVSASLNLPYVGGADPGLHVGEVGLLHVHPDVRRIGIGTQLLNAATGHLIALGVGQLRTWAREPSLPFARRHGFEPSRSAQWVQASLSPSMEPFPSIDDVEILSFSELDPLLIYQAGAAVSADEPGDVQSAAQSFEAWSHDVWDNPDIDYFCSTACVMEGKVVSFSIVLRDGDRIWSDMTGTLRSHRGLGLAFLAKSIALHRAASAGATQAFTGMDSENLPMQAINHHLGYRPVDVMWSCLKKVSPNSYLDGA